MRKTDCPFDSMESIISRIEAIDRLSCPNELENFLLAVAGKIAFGPAQQPSRIRDDSSCRHHENNKSGNHSRPTSCNLRCSTRCFSAARPARCSTVKVCSGDSSYDAASGLAGRRWQPLPTVWVSQQGMVGASREAHAYSTSTVTCFGILRASAARIPATTRVRTRRPPRPSCMLPKPRRVA